MSCDLFIRKCLYVHKTKNIRDLLFLNLYLNDQTIAAVTIHKCLGIFIKDDGYGDDICRQVMGLM